MDDHRNTPVAAQCLGKLISEAGELGVVAGRAVGFGLDTTNSHTGSGQPVSAVEALEQEAGHVLASLDLAAMHRLVDPEKIQHHRRDMLERLLNPARRDFLSRPLAPRPPPGAHPLIPFGVRYLDVDDARPPRQT